MWHRVAEQMAYIELPKYAVDLGIRGYAIITSEY